MLHAMVPMCSFAVIELLLSHWGSRWVLIPPVTCLLGGILMQVCSDFIVQMFYCFIIIFDRHCIKMNSQNCQQTVNIEYMCCFLPLLLAQCVSVLVNRAVCPEQSCSPGLVLQQQTLDEQVIYPTCQSSRCSTRKSQCFGSSGCLLSCVW